MQLSPSADTYIEQMYHVMALQDYLAEYALRLTQATLEQENALYSSTAAHIRHLPWLYLGLFLTAAALMLLLIRVLSRAVVRPLLRLAQASRSIAEGDLSSPDLPVKSNDEVGRLTGTFNQMKHAMAQQLTTQQALHREEVRNLALEKDLEHTRLEVLKSQVNPHFLYNTLDTIRIQAELDGDKKVAKLLMRLVDFFRLSVKVDRSMVTLDDELELVEAYMELMCYRYSELFCDYDIDPDLGAVQVPNFILQPLVENSLLHGMKNRGYRGEIEISVKRAGADMEICIKDSGSGFEEGMKAQIDKMLLHYNKQEAKLDGNSIGILNVQKRIKYLCGRKYGLSYEENSAGGVTARLLLPVWKEEAS